MDAARCVPVEVRRVGTEGVRITWRDGHVSDYPNSYLRMRCPCALCRERPPAEPGAGLYPVQIGVVGRYALAIQWSDGHDTGIYSYQTLRALCPCDRCAGQPERTLAGEG